MATPVSGDYRLRAATPDDARDVTALLERSYRALMRSAYPQDLLARALPLITRANPALLASGTYFVAVSGAGAAVGSGGWTPAAPDTGSVERAVGHIRHFATDSAWTGRGIGRAVYDRSAQQAVGAGIRRFVCYASLNAVPFYAALGFAEIRPIEIPLADDLSFPAMLMQRDL